MTDDPAPSEPLSRVLQSAVGGDPKAADELLPLVYNELRQVARAVMARTPPGQTLQPTALVHEAYLRVVGQEDPGWDGRRHFFAAAARAMREILVDQARRKAARKHGGDRKRVALPAEELEIAVPSQDVLALDEALTRLERDDPRKAQIVMQRYFAGLTIEETARLLGVSHATVEREWRFTRAWLHQELGGGRRSGK